MTLRLIYDAAVGDYEEAIRDIYRSIARTATLAIKDAGDILKTEARADIAAAGFGKRWQNTLRVNFYPEKKESVNASAYLWHKIPYAGVFETGATIRGKPTMWLPLSGTPQKISDRRTTPKVLFQAVGKSFNIIKRPGRKPLLAMSVTLSAQNAAQPNPRITIGILRRSASDAGITKNVPLFVGVDVVKLKDRFSIAEIAESVVARLPELYVKHFRDE